MLKRFAIFWGLAIALTMRSEMFADPGPHVADPLRMLQSRDASLHACMALSLDKSWAVGDRGLILATSDGGKKWVEQPSGLSCQLTCVVMQDDRRGWVAGGIVHPHSLQSEAAILKTDDGGRHWKKIDAPGVSRIVGMQLVDHHHLVAWGDYSPSLRSSVFESMDAGATWSSAHLAIGHVRCAAFASRTRGVIVSKLGQIYLMEDGSTLEQLDLGLNFIPTIHSVHFRESGWWLVGESGVVIHSADGRRWRRVFLPGNAQDHALMSLRSVSSFGDTITIVGQPGTVVWTSPDQGKNWLVQPTGHTLPHSAVSLASPERMIVVGPMASIFGTRNSGNAWWPEHRQAERLGMLHVATSSETAAWGLLCQSTWQHMRQSGVVLMHAQDTESNADYLPDRNARLAMLQSQLGMAHVEALPHWPTRSKAGVSSDYDLAAYDNPDLLWRHLILLLRTWRPDVLVIENQSSGTKIQKSLGALLLKSLAPVESSEFQLFSVQSQIPLEEWSISKVVADAGNLQPDLTIQMSQVLQDSGQFLGDVMRDVFAYDIAPRIENRKQRMGYQVLLNHSASQPSSDVYSGITHVNATLRPFKLRGLGSAQTLLKQAELQDNLLRESASRWIRDARWEKSLGIYLSIFQDQDAPDALLEIAHRSRKSGQWIRWQTALEQLISKYPQTGAGEAACLELLASHYSLEFRTWIDQLRIEEQKTQQVELAVGSVQVDTAIPISPFGDRDKPNQTPIQNAVFTSKSSKSESVQASNLATTPTDHLFSIKRLHSVRTEFINKNAIFDLDWRNQLIIAASQNGARTGNNHSPTHPISTFLADATPIAGWCQLGQQEASRHVPSNMMASFTSNRPVLDGKLDEQLWQDCTPIELSDPWGGRYPGNAVVRIAFDTEYLYLSMHCPTIVSAVSPKKNIATRSWDSADLQLDHLTMRFDIDRDYATYYELTVDCHGQLSDQCCGLKGWNPTWYVDHLQQGTYWTAEIAIPIAQLTPATDLNGQRWAANFHRSLPGIGSQNNGRVASDRFLVQGMRLLQFRDATEKAVAPTR